MKRLKNFLIYFNKYCKFSTVKAKKNTENLVLIYKSQELISIYEKS